MSNDIRIKRGLDIKLKGVAEKAIDTAIVSNFYTIRQKIDRIIYIRYKDFRIISCYLLKQYICLRW